MVLSKSIWSPQNYLDKMVGKCFVFDSTIDNDVDFIETCLIDDIGEQFGENHWSYPLNEIENIVENDIDVVLVECHIWDEKTNNFDCEYRWFEADRDLEWDKLDW